ncbi:MAG: DUF1003 domain-containing protein [Betaproteobacteria bacterium]
MRDAHDIAAKLLGTSYGALDELTRRVARHVAERRHIARNLPEEFDAAPTRGARAADAVARFGGSWVFITLFAVIMIGWVVLNSWVLARHDQGFDPYPYVLLNLFLSMLAAVQAPIILMAQNRQSQKDRTSAEHDYEVNLKAELEIMLLHDKLDLLREEQWRELLAVQNEQLTLLQDLLRQVRQEAAPSSPPRLSPLVPVR